MTMRGVLSSTSSLPDGPAIRPMPPLYEVLFLFSAPQAYLAEIRRLDHAVNAPKSEVYKWLWLEAETVNRMELA